MVRKMKDKINVFYIITGCLYVLLAVYTFIRHTIYSNIDGSWTIMSIFLLLAGIFYIVKSFNKKGGKK
jgi:uncharacterized membrane protein HdeD (DUF308 family)